MDITGLDDFGYVNRYDMTVDDFRHISYEGFDACYLKDNHMMYIPLCLSYMEHKNGVDHGKVWIIWIPCQYNIA